MKNKHHGDKSYVEDEEIVREEQEDVEATEATMDNGADVVEPEVDERDQTISDLNDEIEETRQKVSQLTGILQQLQADFDNYRKRNANVSNDARQKGVCDAVKALLPAFDAVKAAQKQITDEVTLAGLDMVERELINSLKTLDIEPIKTVGEQFDPSLHNAVFAEEVEGVPSGQILEEYGAGYTSPSGVVRFATVKIAK